MDTIDNLVSKTKEGFKSISVGEKYKTQALSSIKTWLTDSTFKEYASQITFMIENKDWEYLLDCFYQIIPFGTGGRRGEVGLGTNRINKWTIQASAQGHSQYLTKKYKNEVKTRGIILTFGVREFFSNSHYNDKIDNPVKNLTGKSIAEAAAEVYAANGVKVRIFDTPRTTPELSFAVRHLNALAGDMFDASHNPPEHNGKKVYDEFGGQLIPPQDEELVIEVTQNVKEIKTIPFDKALAEGIIEKIGEEVDNAFVEKIVSLSLSKERDVVIAFTPLHGVASTSVEKALKIAGFNVLSDPKTSNQSGRFENITFNIPNPEVVESFDTTIVFANKVNADVILNSDPDADRIGVMVKHSEKWRFLNGNEIGSILMQYVIDKKLKTLKGKGYAIKTSVTSNLTAEICKKNGVEIIGELPVGFKYIGFEMNNLEKKGLIDNFLLGMEESHGYIAGNYLRDKDAAIGALWLAELAAELKKENKTLLDYLNGIYSKYGYFRNYLTEIRLPGAEGMSQINKIQKTMRETNPSGYGKFKVEKVEDICNRKPIVSETDKVSKNVLVYHIEPFD